MNLCAIVMVNALDRTSVIVPLINGQDLIAIFRFVLELLHQIIKKYVLEGAHAYSLTLVNVTLGEREPNASGIFVSGRIKQILWFVVVMVFVILLIPTGVIVLMDGKEVIVLIQYVSEFHMIIGIHALVLEHVCQLIRVTVAEHSEEQV